ncbi:hypothetical protein [Halovenus sp. HT40]|uniref:hypothetical protein n=1 Tax=Halovenus sp. HT40 TaxID=3126691 RepID=UPI00300F435B
MTTVVVLADPPVPECVPDLLPDGFDADQNAALYRAMLADVCATIQHGEGEILINYRDPETVPDGVDPENSVRDLLDEELADPGAVRYEVQVGSDDAGKIGNALTHLLDTEELPTVAFARPTALFLRREHIGTTAMQLRTSDVVIGPSTNGRVSFAAFGQQIDFTDVFAPPAVETLTERARSADLDVSFLPETPLWERPEDRKTALSLLRARVRAGVLVPDRTAELVAEWGLSAVESDTVSDNSANSED